MVDLSPENTRLIKAAEQIDAASVTAAVLDKVIDAIKYNDRDGVERYKAPSELEDDQKEALADKVGLELAYQVGRRQFGMNPADIQAVWSARDANGTRLADITTGHYFGTNTSQFRSMLNRSEIRFDDMVKFAGDLREGYTQRVDLEGITSAHSNDLIRIRAGIDNLNEAKSLGAKVKTSELGMEEAVKTYVRMLQAARARD